MQLTLASWFFFFFFLSVLVHNNNCRIFSLSCMAEEKLPMEINFRGPPQQQAKQFYLVKTSKHSLQIV